MAAVSRASVDWPSARQAPRCRRLKPVVSQASSLTSRYIDFRLLSSHRNLRPLSRNPSPPLLPNRSAGPPALQKLSRLLGLLLPFESQPVFTSECIHVWVVSYAALAFPNHLNKALTCPKLGSNPLYENNHRWLRQLVPTSAASGSPIEAFHLSTSS